MSTAEFQQAVEQLLANFEENGQDYLAYVHAGTTRGDEAMVRQKIIEPLLTALGYDLAREVHPEERAGDTIRLAFAFSLTAFAPSTTAPSSEDDRMALAGFYDLLNRDSFLDVERYKREIVEPPHHPLMLTAEQPQNEEKLIGELKREINQLHRLVLLRFRAHRRRVDRFETDKRERHAGIEAARAFYRAFTQHRRWHLQQGGRAFLSCLRMRKS